jgi:hypothetical protein
MATALLFARLATKDLRRHTSEAVLLFLVIATTSATLTLGLVLHGVTGNPYNTTRAATKGPDLVADLSPTYLKNGSIATDADPARLATLADAPGVTAHSGPYPVSFALLTVRGITTSAMVEGRDSGLAPLDQPALTTGRWVRTRGVVVERSFADALGVHVGDRLTLNGRSYAIAGIAVDAAVPPYPHVCGVGCTPIYRDAISHQPISQNTPGLIWLPRADAMSLATPDVGLAYFLNLKLAGPAQATAFASTHTQTPPSGPAVTFTSWPEISTFAAKLVKGPRTVLLVGSGLLILLALASVAVLVGGRLAEQARRVGLLKAVGATPGTVAAVLLCEHLAVTVIAAAAGLAVGRALAPLLARPGAGLLGAAGAPPVTASTGAIVVGVALAVAVLATLAPATQAARTSTVSALADSARPPRRGAMLVALSTRLPVPLLFGVRLAARRPQRLVLGILSVAVTVAGIVAILIERARLSESSGIVDPATPADDRGDVRDHRHARRACRSKRAPHHLGHGSRRPPRVRPRAGARCHPPADQRWALGVPTPRSRPRVHPRRPARHRPPASGSEVKRRLQAGTRRVAPPRSPRNLASHDRPHRHSRPSGWSPPGGRDPPKRTHLTQTPAGHRRGSGAGQRPLITLIRDKPAQLIPIKVNNSRGCRGPDPHLQQEMTGSLICAREDALADQRRRKVRRSGEALVEAAQVDRRDPVEGDRAVVATAIPKVLAVWIEAVEL